MGDEKNRAEYSEWLAGIAQDDELCAAIDAEVSKQIDLTGVVRIVVRRVIDVLQEDGFCAYPFHVGVADEWMADGRCQSCGKSREEHETVLICKVLGGPTIAEDDG